MESREGQNKNETPKAQSLCLVYVHCIDCGEPVELDDTISRGGFFVCACGCGKPTVVPPKFQG